MESYQEFGSMSDRRSSNNRKRLMVTGASSLGLLLLLVAAVAAIVYNKEGSNSDDRASPLQLHSTAKSVEAVCETTDYRHTCESSLSKIVNSSSAQPSDLLKAAVSVISNEVTYAFNHSKLANSADPRIQGAIDVCRRMFYDTKDELASTMENLMAHGVDHLPERSHELTTWLSAVMSYLQTCVDGFPEGELKQGMDKGMVMAREMTSNALAIIKQAADFLQQMGVSGLSRRRLLSEDGVPHWVGSSERRIIKERAGVKLEPNVTVAKDGSGKYKTITKALKNIPSKYKGRYVIYVKEGVYEETVNLTKKMQNVTMFGDGASKTVVTGSKNFVDGTPTFMTATFAAQGDGFIAIAMGFRNTAGPSKHQAVALRVQADRAIFLNCRMDGYQDTLYAQAKRQFYHGCIITGTIDFIFGDAAAFFQKCVMVVRRPMDNQQNIVTAHGRMDRHETTGFVLQKCHIIADSKLKPVVEKIPSYLGRPWKNCSRTVIMESNIGEFIHPDGYLRWDGDFALKTLFYAEYKNHGKGAELKKRVDWPGFKVIKKKQQAEKFTVENFIQGGEWLRGTGTPVHLGLYT